MSQDLVGTAHIVSGLALTIARLEERLLCRSQEDENSGATRPQQTQTFQPLPSHQTSTYQEFPVCSQCQRRHLGVCRHGTGQCFSCGELGHRAATCPRRPVQHHAPYARRLQEYPVCGACQRRHLGTCLVGTWRCVGCGVQGHRLNACPRHESQLQAQAGPTQQEEQMMVSPRLHHQPPSV